MLVRNYAQRRGVSLQEKNTPTLHTMAASRVSAVGKHLAPKPAPPLISRLLVANRGEIAIRVMRSAQELGIATVALITPHDEGALHAGCASEGSVTVSSYLDIQAVVDAAVDSGCTAVHPGYGFLSESAPFAKLVEASGLVFVGPTHGTIAALGASSGCLWRPLHQLRATVPQRCVQPWQPSTSACL